ncbi:hypothetical protein [Plantactinospora sp. CA-290183]|uniref:hypothetical protein n=1 Tax=Plantactinospora sp. CA-290183 TaxID=3240006 RepID=UPI003D8B6C58
MNTSESSDRVSGPGQWPEQRASSEAWYDAYGEAYSALPGRSDLRCPNCGHRALRIVFTGHVEDRVGYASFWCDNCRYGIHISRVSVPDGVEILPLGESAERRRRVVPDYRIVPPPDRDDVDPMSEVGEDMLVARSSEECHLYMELHPCECGEEFFEWSRHHLEERPDHPRVSVYEGTCARCGRERRFEFEVPAVSPEPGRYGDDGPSRIIDPGEFLVSSRQFAGNVPPDPGDLAVSELGYAYNAIDLAVAGVEETLKFVPPGAEAVPPEAFTSELGRKTYDADPDAFTRDRLERTLAEYIAVRDPYAAVLEE